MDEWILIDSYSGGNWSERYLYINPTERTAKVLIFDQIGLDLDGEPEYLEYEVLMTIEEALAEVSYSEKLTNMILKLMEDSE